MKKAFKVEFIDSYIEFSNIDLDGDIRVCMNNEFDREFTEVYLKQSQIDDLIKHLENVKEQFKIMKHGINK